VDGYLMFSCLGPDTLRELRALYAAWAGPAWHAFTDMHDWGDMLIEAGFAEPVMDMERITLTFATPRACCKSCASWAATCTRQRFAGLRGRRWKAGLEQALTERLAAPEHGGQLALTFEIVYGHAYKPTPRVPVAGESAVSLQDMRAMLRMPFRTCPEALRSTN
jgi:malonyl-CoA O-methyltransferase